MQRNARMAHRATGIIAPELKTCLRLQIDIKFPPLVPSAFSAPIVYRLGYEVFILESGVRFPVGAPLLCLRFFAPRYGIRRQEENMSVELHCHTEFSTDGTGTPEALIESAVAHGVTTLAITEHNNLNSAPRAIAHAKLKGLRYLPSIEFDAIYNGESYHFLGIGVDHTDTNLQDLALSNYMVYAKRYEYEIAELSKVLPVTHGEILETTQEIYPTNHKRIANLYAIKSLLIKKGVWESGLETFRRARNEAASKYLSVGIQFANYEAVLRAVHDAGGVLLLAHVSKYLPGKYAEQAELIRSLHRDGVDGFELYHPHNKINSDMPALEKLGRELGCLFSGGTDCHHAPCEEPRLIGSSGATEELIAPLIAALGL